MSSTLLLSPESLRDDCLSITSSSYKDRPQTDAVNCLLTWSHIHAASQRPVRAIVVDPFPPTRSFHWCSSRNENGTVFGWEDWLSHGIYVPMANSSITPLQIDRWRFDPARIAADWVRVLVGLAGGGDISLKKMTQESQPVYSWVCIVELFFLLTRNIPYRYQLTKGSLGIKFGVYVRLYPVP